MLQNYPHEHPLFYAFAHDLFSTNQQIATFLDQLKIQQGCKNPNSADAYLQRSMLFCRRRNSKYCKIYFFTISLLPILNPVQYFSLCRVFWSCLRCDVKQSFYLFTFGISVKILIKYGSFFLYILIVIHLESS